MKISFSDPRLPASGCLILGVAAGPALGKAAKAIDKKSHGALSRLATANGFSGKKGETLIMLAPGGVKLDRLVVVGLGEAKDLTAQRLEEAGGAAYAVLPADKITAAAAIIELPKGAALGEGEAAALFASGFLLRSYRFDKYFTKRPDIKKPVLKHLTVHTGGKTKAQRAFTRLEAIAEAVFFARNLVSEPANVIYPESLARACGALKKFGVTVNVLGKKQMKTLGMGSMLGVAQGSANDPCVITLSYSGAGKGKNKKPVAFVGKGVTFDTGGISLKPASNMEDMKYDMAGSAAVIGTIYALAKRKAKVNAVGVVGAVENMPSGTAQRPGDVVTSMSGQTIEVINTDAEGRLVLCDALTYTQQKFKPRAMVNLATLTGAIVIALGNEHAGLFSNNDELSKQLLVAGIATNEKLWRFPMNEVYDKQLNSDIADMKNASNDRVAGSIFGAQFLRRFVDEKVPWAHLDIAGMAWAKAPLPLIPKGASGYGIRLLEKLVSDYYEGK